MKIQLTQEKLNSALNAVSRVASQRSALPILSNVLLHTENKVLYLTATNLEIAISARVGGKVEKSGKLAIPARLLSDFVSSLPSVNLTLEQNKKQGLKITADKYQSTINGSDPEEFPSIPKQVKGESLSIESTKLKSALQQTTFAASGDEARQVLTGVYLHNDGKGTFMVATDSYRLAEKKLDNSKKSFDHNIPATTMQELLRNLTDSDEKTQVTLSDDQAVFKFGDIVIISRLIDGKYPDYRQIIPTNYEVEAEVERDELLNITRVAGLFARESAGSVMLSVSEEDQSISVESVASQTGENTSEADAKVKGSGEASLNSRYIIDALQAMTSPRVKIMLSGRHSPCVIKPLDGSDYVHLIMPLKS